MHDQNSNSESYGAPAVHQHFQWKLFFKATLFYNVKFLKARETNSQVYIWCVPARHPGSSGALIVHGLGCCRIMEDDWARSTPGPMLDPGVHRPYCGPGTEVCADPSAWTGMGPCGIAGGIAPASVKSKSSSFPLKAREQRCSSKNTGCSYGQLPSNH